MINETIIIIIEVLKSLLILKRLPEWNNLQILDQSMANIRLMLSPLTTAIYNSFTCYLNIVVTLFSIDNDDQLLCFEYKYFYMFVCK